MPNSGAIAFGVFDKQLNDYKGPAVSRIMHDFYELDPKLGLYGGGGFDARFDFTPLSFAPNRVPPGTAKKGAGLQQKPSRKFTRTQPNFFPRPSPPAPAPDPF